MSNDECPWHHAHDCVLLSLALIAPWPQAHECSWLFLTAFHEQSWAFMSTHWHGHYKHPRATMSVPDCQWALMGAHEHTWALGHGAISTHEHGAMRPWALISTHERSLCHSTILMIAHECSWAHMSAYESSWTLMRVHECWTASLNNTQKMLTFEMISL